jgi:hypothetical protein
MFDLIVEIGISVLSNVVQLMIGCLLSISIYYLAAKNLKSIKSNLAGDTAFIAAFSLLGALLPLGPYGVVPVFSALLAAGLRPFIALPLLISNAVFNMLIPYNDVGFAWKTGTNRVGAGRGADYAEVTAQAVENAGGMRDSIKEGDAVLIKPNICKSTLTRENRKLPITAPYRGCRHGARVRRFQGHCSRRLLLWKCI